MAKYSNIKLTQKGLDMAINADKSKKLIYTHIGIGDGRLADSEDVLTLTDMKSRKIFADISDINNDSKNQVTLETIVSNKVVTQGFYAREIGIYAKLGESGTEVLYAYANAGDEADYMPSKEQPIDELKLKITLIVGNIDNVTAIVNSSIIFITLADCRREIQRHNADPLAHGDFARKKDYYTKPETDSKLNTKANRDHGLHVPSIEQANNTRFLRNDNTWQTITPYNIGSYHKNETYNKNEIETIAEQKASTKVNKNGDTMTGTLNFAHNNNHIIGKINDSDYYRITGIATNENNGYLELAVADDTSEGIVVRQYGNKGGYYYSDFSKPVREAWLLNSDGNTSFPQAVIANTFYTNDWFRVNGNGGIHWQNYGGGWFMQDSTWIRAHGNKSIFTAGRMKADGGFEGKATSAGRADSSAVSDRTVRVENDQTNMRFHWNGQGGQPTWLWGGNNPGDMYVYNPSNFTVANAKNFDGRSLQNILGLIDAANTGAVEARLEENGYLKIRNGFMLQWGVLKNIKIDQNNRDVSFVKRFNKCFNVLLTISQDTFVSGANCAYVKRGSITQNGFTVIPDYSIEILDADIFYIAIGV